MRERRTETVRVRVTPTVRDLLTKRADEEDVTISELLRRLATDYVKAEPQR